MEQQKSSRLLANAKQATYLLSLKHRAILQAVMQRPRTMSELVEITGQSMNDTYYRLKQLERADLVNVEREIPRKGRPIKIYRSAAEVFIVPFVHTEEETVYDFLLTHLSPIHNNFLKQVESRLRENNVDIESGFEFKLINDRFIADFAELQDVVSDDIVVSWEMLKLPKDKADEFGTKVLELIEAYRGYEGSNHIVGFYLVRTDTETVRG